MATSNDIDTKSAVRKFLESSTVVDREDQATDTANEITAVLEAVALSFLLYPQAALCFVIQAKNILQQIVSKDRDILDYLLKAIDDVDNPDDPITDISDLVEAQSALVEVDRIGRVATDVQAYDRYTKSINKFLDRRLAKSLKRRRMNEFERSGPEAKQDLFGILSVFNPIHSTMSTKLSQLISGVDNFKSVSLTKIVSAKAVTKVRSSLSQVSRGIQKQQLSKTAIAIELLSGASALVSISNARDIYDPTIDTGSFPSGRNITVSSGRISAIAVGTQSSVNLSGISTPWNFDFSIDPVISDPVSYTIPIPATGASGRSYVKTFSGAQTYNISSSNNVLYVQFDGITPPTGEAAMVRAVALPVGSSVSISSILTALNNVSTGLINGTAAQLGSSGRIIIYGSSSVTKITIKNGDRGTFDGSGNYIPAAGTVHDVLGFSAEQTSGNPVLFSPLEIADLLGIYISLAVISLTDGGNVAITSLSQEPLVSITFSGSVASAFGFSNSGANPTYLELIENGASIDPSSLGVFVGSIVSASDLQSLPNRTLFSPVDSIDGTKIRFAPDVLIPRCSQSSVRIVSPLVFSVQTLFDNIRGFKGTFDQDSLNMQRVLSPLLSKPTQAQISDAQKILQSVRDNVDNLLTKLSNTIVRPDRSEFNFVGQQISSSLTERGLDRGLALLQSCLFADFFALTSDTASKGNRFLTASEAVGRNDLTQTPVEQDQDDTQPLGTTPSDNLLTGEELMEDEEQL